MFFQLYGETAGWQLLGWLMVFAGLVVMNEVHGALRRAESRASSHSRRR